MTKEHAYDPDFRCPECGSRCHYSEKLRLYACSNVCHCRWKEEVDWEPHDICNECGAHKVNCECAGLAELADAPDLKSEDAMHREGSIPSSGTNFLYERLMGDKMTQFTDDEMHQANKRANQINQHNKNKVVTDYNEDIPQTKERESEQSRVRHGSPTFYKLLEEMAALHDKKSYDYASNDNPYGNYHFAGKLALLFSHSEQDAGFVGRLGEKLYRLANLEGSQKIAQNESIEDTERDLCVIMALWIADRKDRRSKMEAKESSK